MLKPIALYKDNIILVRLYTIYVRLVKFFRLDYIDSFCLVKWQGYVMLSYLCWISKVSIVMLLRLD